MSAATQRQRSQRALASFLSDPWVDGKYRDFHGDPRKAPKRWKRLWARQLGYVRGVTAARRLQLRMTAKRAASAA